MNKLFALTLVTVALAGCNSMMSGSRTANTGNPTETRNSTDGNKSGNPAAVSPAGGTGGGAAGTGAGGAAPR